MQTKLEAEEVVVEVELKVEGTLDMEAESTYRKMTHVKAQYLGFL